MFCHSSAGQRGYQSFVLCQPIISDSQLGWLVGTKSGISRRIQSCTSHREELAKGGTMLLLYTSRHASKSRLSFYDRPLSAQAKLLLSLRSSASIHHRLRPRSRCTSIGYPSIVAIIQYQSTFPTWSFGETYAFVQVIPDPVRYDVICPIFPLALTFLLIVVCS